MRWDEEVQLWQNKPEDFVNIAEGKITILSRNKPLEIYCSQCGKNPAEWVNPEGIYDETPFWCEECVSKAEEENEEPGFLLPVCNSPRMGVCGYEGSDLYPDEFQLDES